jgi:hypothetical protein
MYNNTIQNLVIKVGETFMIENIPKYIIQLSTDMALNRSAFAFNMADTLPSIVDMLKLNVDFVKQDADDEMLYVIENLSKCDIKYEGFDCLVISNGGKYNVILKLANDKKGRSLYLDIQAIRIDMIDKQTTDNFNYYYNMFNYGLNTCISVVTFQYFYSDVYKNMLNSTFKFFGYIGTSFQNRINSVSKIS